MSESDSSLVSEEISEASQRRVLIVDDDPDALRIVGDFLESRGFTAIPAVEGQEALARFHDDGPFDAIVLDVMMPGIDGLEVCRRLKSSPQGQLTPILLLSARTDTRSRIAGLYGGADDYMSKPVDLREFAARVDVLIRLRDRYKELAGRRRDEIEAAICDGLSAALNREYFERRLEEEIRRCDRYSVSLTVVVMDLLGLPEPEGADSLDGNWGDEQFASPAFKLVRAVGLEMRSSVRSPDLLARLRGGRFALMLPHTSKHVVQKTIDRLQQIAVNLPSDPSVSDGPKAGLSLAVGLAELGPRMDASTLLARAEPR